MIDFLKKNIFIIALSSITLFIGFLTFLTFIDRSFIELNQNNLQYLLILNIFLLILLFVFIFIEIKRSIRSDIDKDGYKDIIVSGNMYNSEVETPRNDGSVGVYLKFTPDSGFEAVSTQKSGLFINGDVKDMEFITLNNTDYIISAKNDDLIEFTKIK